MSLFIGLLAFDEPLTQDKVKIGILLGSALSGVAGPAVLMASRRRRQAECHDAPWLASCLDNARCIVTLDGVMDE
ncbi:Na+/H+ antiporter NhaA [Rhizobium tibeticum]|uniref:Na+/H+ antiporter NhaA n=1 Tax=Rhizobium tibeticum TaxID=501024 RepID=UPI0027D8DB53|nr:Na+/H+ antiporter NhaA [Rhizobium tibeticum]